MKKRYDVAFTDDFKNHFLSTDKLKDKREILEDIEESVWWITANLMDLERKEPIGTPELETIAKKVEQSHPESLEFAKAIIEYINLDIKILSRYIALRTRDLGDALIREANANNFLACAIITRSLLETSAFANYCCKEICRYHAMGPLGAEPSKELRRTLRKLRYGTKIDWVALLFQKRTVEDLKGLVREEGWKLREKVYDPYRIGKDKIVEELDKSCLEKGLTQVEGEILFHYSILCDMLHPNFGGHFLFMGKSGRLSMQHSDVRWISAIVILPAANLLRSTMLSLQELEKYRFDISKTSP